MLADLATISWSAFPQPEWNAPDAVPWAIRQLASAASMAEGGKAYHRFLYAVGNDHAGTYYPVILPALPFLAEILEAGSIFAREAVLDVLIDVCTSFYPANGHETVEGPSGAQVSLETLVRERVAALSPLLKRIEGDPGLNEHTRVLATQLLQDCRSVSKSG